MLRTFTYGLMASVLMAAPGAASGGATKVINKEDLAKGKPATAPAEAAPAAEKGPSKSIVPAKYGKKYRDGGSDELAKFINDQCFDAEKKEIDFTKYFKLCRDNGLDEAKVKSYEDLVATGARGSQGRARMTLRNMLATPARKNGHLVGLDGKKHAVKLEERAPSGAAAKAKEGAAAKEPAAA